MNAAKNTRKTSCKTPAQKRLQSKFDAYFIINILGEEKAHVKLT
jgi:hypothetical protein